MDLYKDNRVVMTLDAGGTNFVFSALQYGEEIISSIVLPSNAHDLDLCLKTIIQGFEKVNSLLSVEPSAISFAFPGPADYKSGIIGDLINLPAFRGGIPLAPMLEEHFQIPTYISNDGDLFAYGEAMAGVLPEVNKTLEKRGVKKRYRNLLGITLGTGFGGGMVMNNELCEGDNSSAGEIWLLRDFSNTKIIVEESVSIRAVQRVYAELVGENDGFTPKEIYEIASGNKEGDQQAAVKAFNVMAENIAEALSNAITLLDGIIVIGGGISGAYPLLAPKIVECMNGTIENLKGDKINRLTSTVYDLENLNSAKAFFEYDIKEVQIPFSSKTVQYTPEKRIAISKSKLGTSKAISLGAYAVALKRLNQEEMASM